MEQPKNIQEIEAWLEPLDYEEFWQAITPHCRVAAIWYRIECDEYVESGVYSRDEALRVYKFCAIEAFAWRLDPAYDRARRDFAGVTFDQLTQLH